jgi:hypothetical protein
VIAGALMLYLSTAIVVAIALDSDRRIHERGAWFPPLAVPELFVISALWLPVFIVATVAVIVDAAAATRRR